MTNEDTELPGRSGSALERPVVRLEPRSLTPREVGVLNAALMRTAHKVTGGRMIGCNECAWGKVAGCWRCGGR